VTCDREAAAPGEHEDGSIAVFYDFKTSGGMSERRAELRAATGVDRSVPIIELRVCADPTDCTFAVPWWD
jgi:hypothetical protein